MSQLIDVSSRILCEILAGNVAKNNRLEDGVYCRGFDQWVPPVDAAIKIAQELIEKCDETERTIPFSSDSLDNDAASDWLR